MKNTRIYGALIIIAVCLALFLLVFFGADIKVSQQVVTKIDTSKNVAVYLDGKQYEYVNNNPTNYYYIINPANNEKTKCYLDQDDSEKGKFYCKDTKDKNIICWYSNESGAYPSTLEFGNMKLFQYFIYF